MGSGGRAAASYSRGKAFEPASRPSTTAPMNKCSWRPWQRSRRRSRRWRRPSGEGKDDLIGGGETMPRHS
eukprot:7772002-Pyramimonas_sp.AAC.2